MKITKNMQRLIDDARSAGLDVTINRNDVLIVRRTPKLKRVSYGLVIYESGTAFDVKVDLAVARGIRSFADMRSILRLGRT